MNPGGLAVMSTALGTVTVLAFSAGPRPAVRLTFNATESASVGFYTVDPPRRIEVGDQVLSRLPGEIAALGERRRYVPATTPVLKSVAAEAGAVICRSGPLVSIDARPAARARTVDRAGRPLPVWQGCRRLDADEVFLLGRHPDSFDGRYFGPTATALILGKARPLWTW